MVYEDIWRMFTNVGAVRVVEGVEENSLQNVFAK